MSGGNRIGRRGFVAGAGALFLGACSKVGNSPAGQSVFKAAQGWHRVQDLWPRMLADEAEAVREWLVEAEKLVESFRETRALFLTSRVSLHSRGQGIVVWCSTDGGCSIADSGACSRGARGSRLRRRMRIVWRRVCNSTLVRPSVEISCDLTYCDADSLGFLGRDSLARKAAKSENVSSFRGISFEDWLRLFMHVEFFNYREYWRACSSRLVVVRLPPHPPGPV